jgi:methylisocitrate lyase
VSQGNTATNERKTTRLKRLINDPKILVVPRVHDCISALSAEKAGFQAVQVSGFGLAATLLGKPDFGLLTYAENLMMTRYIAAAVDVPVMADADTGYGNALNVYRTVQGFEDAGVAGINIEDQVYPKKCGHMDGKAVISAEEMVQKVRAAVDARRDPDLVICARTDAIATYGIEEAIRRGKLYAAAGADLVFVEAPTTKEMIARVVKEIDAPVSINIALGGKTPPMSWDELEALGVARVSVGGSYFVAGQAFKKAHETLLAKQSLAGSEQIMPRQEFYDLVKMPFFQELEQRYLSKEELTERYGER